jgi:hypothetical protein
MFLVEHNRHICLSWSFFCSFVDNPSPSFYYALFVLPLQKYIISFLRFAPIMSLTKTSLKTVDDSLIQSPISSIILQYLVYPLQLKFYSC